ncbi:putative MFS family arabinose efflux permease [Thermocatellispora tengchongensis]|uniref:Putative MFS family arabinose efflux permease n=1 Tax=Thermocatellispora tengchongensis TaxID=1073253 RepID=A0A840PFC8_9ACTN|nr:MFS transporter [Thermocatellispora tengchongensis]MBB5137872.1 putative MFS family arabinose efflux permease [Thermocatellispora tengchongensis]
MTARTPVSPTRRRLTLLILLGVTLVSLLDRQIMAILAHPIAEDLNLTDSQLGLLSGVAFAAVYATLTIPVGWMADRVDRTRIIAVATASWSVISATCGLAGNFWHLLISRMGVAVGEAGATPSAHSIASDLYPPERRGFAIATIQAGSPLGLLLAFAVGGLIAQEYGWRAAFYASAVPGLVMTVLVLAVMRDPRARGGTGAAAHRAGLPRHGFRSATRELLANPPMRSILAGGVLCAFGVYGALAWLPAYFQRTFDWSSGRAGIVLGLMFGVVGLAGTWGGGVLGDRLYLRRRDGHTRVVLLSSVVVVALFPLFLAAPGGLAALLVLAIPAGLLGLFQGPLAAAVQNVCPPSRRGLASAFYIFSVNLLGQSLGPTAIGVVSDLAESAGLGNGLRAGLLLVPLSALAAVIVLRRAGARILAHTTPDDDHAVPVQHTSPKP